MGGMSSGIAPKWSTVACLFLGVIAAGCVPAENAPETARFVPTAQEQAELQAYGLAVLIADRCDGDLRANTREADRVLRPTVERAQEAGVRNLTDLVGISRAEGRKMGQAYVAERSIVQNSPATWCSAGKYELANKTRIGSYLLLNT